MESSAVQKREEERRRLELLLRSAPRSVQTANNLLLLAALFMFGDRMYYAWSHHRPLWMGLIAGGFCATLAFRGGMAIFHKKRFAYWGVIAVSGLVLLRAMIHVLAEGSRFFFQRAEVHASGVSAAIYCFLSAAILLYLLRRDSREYVGTVTVETKVEVVDEQDRPPSSPSDGEAIRTLQDS
ncbi:MAG TPA: hypothetical protein VMV10_29085 [Pirellulales bacterium]|nr:hypothetical protein [Pirellulales bacterium]